MKLARALALCGASEVEKLYVDDVFSTYLYAGTGSVQTINNGIDLAKYGGMVWAKRRDSAADHILWSPEFGYGNQLASNFTNGFISSAARITNTTSTGYTLGASTSVNASLGAYTSWTFRKAPKFFYVVTWTGNGVVGRQIPHSLGIAPGMVIGKITSGPADWRVWHRSTTAGTMLLLNTTTQETTSGAAASWGNGSSVINPTATAFTVGTSLNADGATYVAYLFAHDPTAEGLIQCGGFTTDSSGNATVELGWEPQWAKIKLSSATGDWVVLDSMRGWANGSNDAALYPNESVAEASVARGNPTATGFVFTGAASTTYIYTVIRRPNKPPKSGAEVFMPFAGGTVTVATTGFPSDLAIQKNSGFLWENRLVGDTLRLSSSAEDAETTANSWSAFTLSSINLMTQTYFNNLSALGMAAYAFRRAPGFMDIVCYKGSAGGQAVTHGLKSIPEFYVVKGRAGGNWWAYHAALGHTSAIRLNLDVGKSASGLMMWNGAPPTATAFSVADNFVGLNTANETYVAYLFASLPGISKVGSYTGNGASQTIDCGFAAGARFVLIKRADAAGDWFLWDTARGIVAANDPHLSLNTTAAEVTTDDSVDPAGVGFIVNQNTATNINVLNGTYIFLAIA